jgi:hypothetical protein
MTSRNTLSYALIAPSYWRDVAMNTQPITPLAFPQTGDAGIVNRVIGLEFNFHRPHRHAGFRLVPTRRMYSEGSPDGLTAPSECPEPPRTS